MMIQKSLVVIQRSVCGLTLLVPQKNSAIIGEVKRKRWQAFKLLDKGLLINLPVPKSFHRRIKKKIYVSKEKKIVPCKNVIHSEEAQK